MPKQLTNWLDEFVENGADPSDVIDWPENSGGGTSYTAGNGITITNHTISIDEQIVALKQEEFSGDYNDLENKPTIPTLTSQLQNDSGYITGVSWDDVTNKPSFATVATSGDYDDLINKPTITNVEANTGDTPSATLNTLTVGDTVYNIPGGGSGSEYYAGDGISIDENNNISANIYGDNDAIDVSHGCDGELEISLNSDYKVTANSGDDPTTSLSTLTVGDIVYSIPEAVSGEHDGNNWTSLTIGEDTYNIPSGGSGTSYTAGTGIDITNNEISVDNTVAMKTDIPDAVSGTNDGTNWTNLTIGSDTYAIPTSSGGSGIIEENTTNFNILGSSPSGRLSGIYKVNAGQNNLTITSGNNSIVIPNSPTQGNCVVYIHIFNNMNSNQRKVFWYAFLGQADCTIYYGYVTAGTTSGQGVAKSAAMSNIINRDLISYKLSLTFTKDNVDSYMDFIFSNENVIGNINTTTFKALFDTTEALIGDKKLCDINHTVRIYNNGTYTIGDIYYDSTTDTFGTVDGTITGLTLSSITKTEKSHTLPN